MKYHDSGPNQRLNRDEGRRFPKVSLPQSRLLQKVRTFKQAEAGASYILTGLCMIPLLFLFILFLFLYRVHAVGWKLRLFRYKEDGGVLVLVGLLLTPLISMLGLAVDTATGLEQKRKLQAAVDAAAKAGLANGNGDVATITAEIQKVFAVNTATMKNIIGPVIDVNTGANIINVSARVKVNNTFMNIGGIPLSTYNASSSVPLSMGPNSEVAIVFEVSGRSMQNNFHQTMCDELIKFVDGLPKNVMVSITPIATEFLLDPATTSKNALFSHLDSGSNDEIANPGFFPLSPTQSWNTTNYSSVKNPFYTKGPYAVFPNDPDVLTSNLTPGMCKIPKPNYPSCSSVKWPNKCPSTKNISCSQVYSYQSGKAYPILPLTLNKTLAVNYIKDLKNFAAPSDGFFPSLLSWGWRTIDPSWNDFWLINSEANNTARTITKYPQPYGSTYKSMVLVFNGNPYWDGYKKNISSIYNNKCGNAQKVVNGLNHWLMTGYGMVPVPTNSQAAVNDITCENRWYKTMDKSLGLNLSDATNYNSTVDTPTYAAGILNEVGAKFYRVCNNIKTKNIDIFVLSNNNIQSLSACSNLISNTYPIENSSTSIAKALDEVKTKIAAKSTGPKSLPTLEGPTGGNPNGSGGNENPPNGGGSGKGDGKPGGDGKPTGGASGKGDGKPTGGASGKSDGKPSGDGKPNGDGKGDGKPTGGASGKGDGKPTGGASGKSDGKPSGDGKPNGDGKGDGKPTGGASGKGDGKPTGGASGKSDGKSDGKPSGDDKPNGDGKGDGKPTGGASGKGDGKPTGGASGKSDGKPSGDGKPNGDGKGDGKPTGGASGKGDGKPTGGASGKGDGKPSGDSKPNGDGKGDGKPSGDGKPTGGASGKGDGKPTGGASGKSDGKPTGGGSGKGDGKSNGDGKPNGDGKGDGKSNGDSKPTGGASVKGDGKSNGDGKPNGDGKGEGKPGGDGKPNGDGKGDGKSNGDGKPTGGASGKGEGKPGGDGKPTGSASGKGDGKSNGDSKPTGGATGKGDGKSNGDGKPTDGASGKGDGKADGKPTGGASGKGDGKSNGDSKPTGGGSGKGDGKPTGGASGKSGCSPDEAVSGKSDGKSNGDAKPTGGASGKGDSKPNGDGKGDVKPKADGKSDGNSKPTGGGSAKGGSQQKSLGTKR